VDDEIIKDDFVPFGGQLLLTYLLTRVKVINKKT